MGTTSQLDLDSLPSSTMERIINLLKIGEAFSTSFADWESKHFQLGESFYNKRGLHSLYLTQKIKKNVDATSSGGKIASSSTHCSVSIVLQNGCDTYCS